MALTRSFRAGLDERDGRQRPVRSNFSSGPAVQRTPGIFGPTGGNGTGQGYGTGIDYRTALKRTPPPIGGNPSVEAPASTLLAPAVASKTGLQRSVPLTPNAGGTITRGGQATSYAPSSYSRQVAPGVMATAGVPPSPPAIRSQMTPPLPTTMPAAMQPALDSAGAPVASPATATPAPPPQTERQNPLTGATGEQQPEGTTEEINPGQALGFSQRGAGTPSGSDAMPEDGTTGGAGLYAKKFKSKQSASIYSDYVRKLGLGGGGMA